MKKPVIICIDDEPIILNAMRSELRDAFGNDYLVEICESGREALTLIDELIKEKVEIPLVIVDYLLPDTQGNELLLAIQKQLPSTRKIMLTGVGNIEEVAKAIQSVELYSYISKPWENLALIFTAKGAIKNYQQELSINYKNNQLKELNKSLEKRVKKRTQKLADLVLLRDKILSIVGHDIRTPLASLQSSLILMNWQMISKEEGEQLLQEISTKMGNTLSLLENLLNWANQQMGGIQTQTQTFLLNSVAKDVISILSPVAKDKNIEVRLLISSNPEVKADFEHIHLVLRNLISNAIKFTEQGGKVVVEVLDKETFVEVAVIDNGVGMSALILNSLFKKDEVTSQLGTNNEFGTGLGLILCDEFIKMNNGYITVHSKEGEGTTFRFTLPKP